MTYTTPSVLPQVGGLYNNVFMYIQAGTTTDVTNARTSIETGGVIGAEVQGVIASGKFTITSLPALVRVPSSEYATSGNNYFELWGLQQTPKYVYKPWQSTGSMGNRLNF